jgi:hypothetical protein
MKRIARQIGSGLKSGRERNAFPENCSTKTGQKQLSSKATKCSVTMQISEKRIIDLEDA